MKSAQDLLNKSPVTLETRSSTSTTATGQNEPRLPTELVEAVDSFDDKELKKLIKRHQEETGSAWAKYLLQHWKTTRKNFLRVAPKAQAATIEAKNEGVVR